MADEQQSPFNRRNFLKLVTTVPVLGAIAALASPLLRFLKPNVEKFQIYSPTAQDVARGEALSFATLSALSKPWYSNYFVFSQKYPLSSPAFFHASSFPVFFFLSLFSLFWNLFFIPFFFF